jgi:hypothetical protein
LPSEACISPPKVCMTRRNSSGSALRVVVKDSGSCMTCSMASRAYSCEPASFHCWKPKAKVSTTVAASAHRRGEKPLRAPVLRRRTMRSVRPFRHRHLEGGGEALLVFVHLGGESAAGGAVAQVRQCLAREAARVGEFLAAEFEAVHVHVDLLARSLVSRWARSACRARVRRVITAPSLVPSMAAISLQS